MFWRARILYFCSLCLDWQADLAILFHHRLHLTSLDVEKQELSASCVNNKHNFFYVKVVISFNSFKQLFIIHILPGFLQYKASFLFKLSQLFGWYLQYTLKTSIKFYYFEGIRKFWHTLYNGGPWEILFSGMNKQPNQYICLINDTRVTFELFQCTEGWLWYSQPFKKTEGLLTCVVGKQWRIPKVMLIVFRVCNGTLNNNQSKECEYIMEFPMTHFIWFFSFLSKTHKTEMKWIFLNNSGTVCC